MNEALLAQGLALALTAIALVLALAVLTSRSLFALTMAFAALSAVGAGAALALGYGDGALALALFGIGFAPALLLGGVLLTARAAKPRRARPWLSIVGGGAVGALVLWALRDLGGEPATQAEALGGLGLWVALLVFVGVACAVGLLGYGERGVLERVLPGRER